MAATVTELNQDIAKLLKQTEDLTEKGYENWSAEEVESFRKMNDDLNSLYDSRKQAEEIEAMIADTEEKRSKLLLPNDTLMHPKTNVKEGEQPGSIGEWFVKSAAFTDYSASRRQSPEVELEVGKLLERMPEFGAKDLFTTGDYPSVSRRLPGYIEYPRVRPTIASLMPQGTTEQAALTYVAELEGTNAAGFVAEGEEKPESALGFEERTAAVRKIATWLPVTDEIMEDEPALRSIIDARLRLFIELAEEEALVNGANNNSPNFRGFLNEPGIQTQAKGNDPTPDAVMKAMTKIQVNAKFQPSGVVMHPFDWQNIRLLKTADGVYIWGSPAEEGPMRLWGLPVGPSEALPQGTAVVGAFNVAAQIFRRTGITFAVSDSHADMFTHNQLAIRAEERLAFVIYRPAAFCTVTGLMAP